MMRAIVPAVVLCAAGGLLLFGCNRRVFEQFEPACNTTLATTVKVPTEKAADILIVVDNSGSMLEEQQNLANNFVNDACPIPVNQLQDFATCEGDNPAAICDYANPTPDLLAGALRDCGFIQILAAFGNDFRVGVITTDIGVCDNRYPAGQADLQGFDTWGFRPQRGCLQPNGPPDTDLKVIARADLTSGDATTRDIGTRFRATLDNIRTFGTPVERGLDAAKLFLDPNTDRAAGCEDDLNSFLRENAKLVVIFLTDEQDCSRFPEDEIFDCPAGEDCTAGFTEFTNETCGEFIDHFTSFPPITCYEREDDLTSVSRYAAFLRSVKKSPEDVSVAVIAGGVPQGDVIVPGGCKISSNVPDGNCNETGGNSNQPDCNAVGANCCVADHGDRYFELVNEVGGLKDSICFTSFAPTMIRIASFIGSFDVLKLVEPPTNPDLIVVELTRAGGATELLGQRLSGTSCDDRDGWVMEDTITIRLCGSKRPAPGDEARVLADGGGGDPSLPVAERCKNRDEAPAP